jgi:LacI family transcriptional regulator
MRRRRGHITLSDIAAQLNVSRVTVSKALRGHPDISDDMTHRIRQVAKDLRYSPNIIARSLSARRSSMIGLVVPKIAHFFFGSVIEGVYNAAFTNNYETILTVSQENPERERKHLETLVSMRVDGIIISITQTTDDLEIFDWIKRMGVPLLFIDRQPDPPLAGFSSIMVDDKGGAFKAVEHAINVGYTKFGCIGGQQNINIGKLRMAGFEAALEHHGIPLESRWVYHGGFGKSSGYEGFMTLYRNGELPEFIFAMTYPIALGVYEAVKHIGLRIPEDIDIMCFGDSDVNHIITPALSCVLQPSYQLGAQALEFMLKMLSGADGAPEQHVVLPTELQLRETCTGKKHIVSTSSNTSQACWG